MDMTSPLELISFFDQPPNPIIRNYAMLINYMGKNNDDKTSYQVDTTADVTG